MKRLGLLTFFLLGAFILTPTLAFGACTQYYGCSDVLCDDGAVAPGSGCYTPDTYYSDCRANCPPPVTCTNNTAVACSKTCDQGIATGTYQTKTCSDGTTPYVYTCTASCPSCTITYSGWDPATNPDYTCTATQTRTATITPAACNGTSTTLSQTSNTCVPAHSAYNCNDPTGNCKLTPSTPSMSGLAISPTSMYGGAPYTLTATVTSTNSSSRDYSPKSGTAACNTTLTNVTNTSVSVTPSAVFSSDYYPTTTSGTAGTVNYTSKAWIPTYSAVAVSPTSAYDDQFIYLTRDWAGNTNQDLYKIDGTAIPSSYNGDTARGVGAHSITFHPQHHDSFCADTTGSTSTETHTTNAKPVPVLSAAPASNKPLSYKGQPVVISGTISNAQLWNFFVELHYDGTDANAQVYDIGRSNSNEYPSATYPGITSSFSGNNFTFTIADATETTSTSAYIRISYARAGRDTGTRIGNLSPTTLYEVAPIPTVSAVTAVMEGGVLVATITGDKFRILSKQDDVNYKGDVFFNTTTKADAAGFKGNITSWTMDTIKVAWPPMTGDVKVCLKTPIADGCSISNNQYYFPTDKDVTTVNNSWWTYKVLPPPECTIEIIKPPLIDLYVLSKRDTSDPFLVKATWKNFDLRSPINITPVLNPLSDNVEITGPLTFVTTGVEKGDSTVQLIAVTKKADQGWYDLTITGRSPIAGGWDCTEGKLRVRVDVDPFLKTTGGDVHSNKEISVPGGP